MKDDPNPTFADMLRNVVDARLSSVYIGPGRIESYNDAEMTCSVKPLLMNEKINEDGEREAVEHPVVNRVPVIFPGAGGRRIKFPVARGDIALVIPAAYSMDRWIETGGDVDPEDGRILHLSDLVAIPGLLPAASAADKTPIVEFTDDGRILVGGDQALTLASEFAELKNQILTDPALAAAGTVAQLRTALIDIFTLLATAGSTVTRGA